MKKRTVLNISLFALLANALSACLASHPFYDPPLMPTAAALLPKKEAVAPKGDVKKEEHHKIVAVEISLEQPQGTVKLGADVYRPDKRIDPKTLVILAPGSGNVSRKGEVTGDGIATYPAAIEQSALWGQALSDAGIFVLAYDKRTCTKAINPLCGDNQQTDINTDGIAALARDLDGVCRYAMDKFADGEEGVRVVLMSSTQGTQVLSHSACAKMSSGLAILSPIVGDLAESWGSGLMRAHEAEKNYVRKNNLLNQSESIKSFFSSLREGRFADSAQVRGTSVQFWRSWVKASFDTMPKLIDHNANVLMLFNKGDVFSSEALVSNIAFLAKNKPKIKIKTLAGGDRNFIENTALSTAALNSVLDYIKSAPTVKLSPIATAPDFVKSVGLAGGPEAGLDYRKN